MIDAFVLDACALIAFLSKEPGYTNITELLHRAQRSEITLLMHNINLLEVYYDLRRAYGEMSANAQLTNIRLLPVVFISEVEGDCFIEAGRLKTTYRVSLADAIALSTAVVHNAAIVTCDHHEMDVIDEEKEGIEFYWIR
jgi:predicted nucleic acid-binding protein